MSTFWKKLLISILGLVIISIFVCRIFEETVQEGFVMQPQFLLKQATDTAAQISTKIWQLVTSVKDALTAAEQVLSVKQSQSRIISLLH